MLHPRESLIVGELAERTKYIAKEYEESVRRTPETTAWIDAYLHYYHARRYDPFRNPFYASHVPQKA